LEAIAVSYDITRERVRQIEAATLAGAKKQAGSSETYQSFEKLAFGHLEQAGGARIANKFLGELQFLTNDRHPAADARLKFLLALSSRLRLEEENYKRHSFWVSDAAFAPAVIKFLDIVTRELKKKRAPLSLADAGEFLSRSAAQAGIAHFPTGALIEFTQISKEISINPYGEWGLAQWPGIVPAGAKDRAYCVLKQCRKPLHFNELSSILNQHARLAADFHPAWQKTAEMQTVHNELIKDKRFVLVGRGIYALSEWGYTPGTVREVIAETLRDAGKPLSKEEILRRVKTKRFVKDATIFINLQNSRAFERLKDGKYRLREKLIKRGDGFVREA
jgi:hypothetical protein